MYDESRPASPRSIGNGQIAELIPKVLGTSPKKGTHLICINLGEEAGRPKSTVHCVCKAFGPQPISKKYFPLSTDLFFVEKVQGIVRLVGATAQVYGAVPGR